jgi:CubicO group peptidase (beta-lactamase class C family)
MRPGEARAATRRAVVAAIWLVCFAAFASDAGTVSIDQRLDAYLRAATARGDFNGTVLVVRDGRVLLRRGYGYADVSARTPNRPSTRFRISSLTGDITHIALLQLVERGRLNLDDSLCEHLQPCPATWRPVTVRLLLTSRSGLPSARPLPPGTLTLAEWMARLRARPLAFAAGRGRDRSETPSLVGAHILELVSGSPLFDVVRRNVLRRAGMTATVLDRPGLPRRATPYVRRRNGRLGPPTSIPALSEPDALYGLASTVDDMYRFDVARRSGRLVSRALLAEVAPPSTASQGQWPDQFAHLGHGPRGTSDGWYTAFARDAADNLTILAFSNTGGLSLSDVLQRVGLIAIGWPPQRVQRSAAELGRYAGTYHRWDGSKKRRVTSELGVRRDGTLLLNSDEPAHPRSPRPILRRSRWSWVLVPTVGEAFYASGAHVWWGIRLTVEAGATTAEDLLVIRFVPFGGEYRYRRAS